MTGITSNCEPKQNLNVLLLLLLLLRLRDR